MKLQLLIYFFFCSCFLSAQLNYQVDATAKAVGKRDSLFSGESAIYGSFIQRLGFSSGGVPQDIRIRNIDTKKVYTCRVKPTMKSARQNDFFFIIPAGRYEIFNYYWIQSKWYGTKTFHEPIYKGVDATDNFNQKVKDGQLELDQLERYSFVIEKNTLNYMGTWHFITGLVHFSNQKAKLDAALAKEYKYIDFAKSVVSIPE